jgi:hypothetical protein
MKTWRRWLLVVSTFLVLVGLLLSSWVLLFPRNLGVTWLAYVAIRKGMSEDRVRSVIGEVPWGVGSRGMPMEQIEMWGYPDGPCIMVYFRMSPLPQRFMVQDKVFIPSKRPLWEKILFSFQPSPRPFRLQAGPQKT